MPRPPQVVKASNGYQRVDRAHNFTTRVSITTRCQSQWCAWSEFLWAFPESCTADSSPSA